MKKISTSVLSIATLAVLSTACVKIESLDPVKAITKTFQGKKKKDTRIQKSSNTDETITIGSHNMRVVSMDVIQKKLMEGKIHSSTSARAQKMLADLPSTSAVSEVVTGGGLVNPDKDDLVVGFPISLLGEQNIFGAVITKVSEKKNEELGGLKLTDLTPIHVKTLIGRTEVEVIKRDNDGKPVRDAAGNIVKEIMEVPALALVGCMSECTERSKQEVLIPIPITEVDDVNGILYLNVSLLGQGLNLVAMMDPDGEFTKLKARESETTEVDYDLTTLVFDVNSKFIPKDTPEGSEATAPVSEFTVRWYMKMSSSFNPAYESRLPTPAVGFFQTDRSKTSKIQRFSITENGKKIKYFIKNVPKEYRPYFKGALDNWNVKFKETVGVEPLSYEFIEKEDARHAKLVPGDIRYNIIEWDEDNKAPYGGLGPSIANQYTGETISANVLIQGPTIIEMYTKWFGISKEVRELQSAGEVAEANKIIREFNAESKEIVKSREGKFSLTLGKKLAFTVQSQRPELEDPIIKNHFEVVPAGVTFEEYMKGYFTEMLEHELGHNLGLRHNFKGNLGATDSGQSGSAARSIMEYLGRPYRHLNEIGLYDEMAIRYGYAGEAPKRANWFCTDEHQAAGPKNIATASPECSKGDATSDPFSFWEARMKRALDLVIDMKTASAPVWKTEEVAAQVQEFSIALANYAASAEKTAETWTNFFGKADRPEDKTKVKAYVLTKMKAKLCDPALAEAIKAKESQEAQTLAQTNLDNMRKMVVETNKALTVFTEAELKCN